MKRALKFFLSIMFFNLVIFQSFNFVIRAQTMSKAFINGKIYTVNEKQPYAEAVVIEGNKIIFAGSESGAQKFIKPNTEVIDLEGKLMLPGFNDSHLHFISGGNYLLGINLRPALSKEKFVKIIEDYINNRRLPDSVWITGGRWDHELWPDKSLPTKELIDSISPNTPVFVSRIDGHMGLANSKALELAGITKYTKDPDGGLIVRDSETGEPTGILKDNAMGLVFKVIPPPSLEENIEAALRAIEEARKLGVTSVQDMTQFGELDAYQKVMEDGKLTCRIYSIWPIDKYETIVRAGVTVGNEKGFIKRGALKGYADGSLGASTAWFFEPYVNDPSNYGLPMDVVTNGNLEKWAFDVDRNRLQLCVHAIGDRANAFMLDLYQRIKEGNAPWDRRFRIEHAQHLRRDDIYRFAEIGVIASVQPYHCIDDGVWAEKRIGPERIKSTHVYHSLIESGAVVAFGTDWPVAPLNPLLGIYAAVTRRTVDGKNPDGWIPEEKIAVEDAIKCYTLNAAYASFEEKLKGSIEAGKLADFVVLSNDILNIDPVKIKDVVVEMTVFNGDIVYEREK
ncbi:MAG: amidohydrolase [Ignavibacteriaceae bacterium]|nr:amidohydrolase [Ignavibacteriaceae bacterium]MCW8813758.1 amidohydrolase [Chlorobium sp.]MCW8818488.1 amidohydrolase [Ignavibacteriaceae bacterium]